MTSEIKPRPYPHAVDGMKYDEYLGFEGGSLTIRTTGYDVNGWGWFCFAEGEAEYETDDETGKYYRIINVANSELIAIRDKLNEIFPLASLTTMQRERDEAREELKTALRLMHTARHIAIIAHGHWDSDEDSKVGKLLLALSGVLPKYRSDIDEIHAFLARYEAAK